MTDVYEEVDFFTGQPYPMWARARAECPVMRTEDGDAWRLDRESQPHLAFGRGPHLCLGMHLARLELRTGLNAILDRLPGLRLDPDAPAPTIQGLAFRGPDALPVRFDPSP